MWSRLVAYSAEGKGFFLVLHLLNVGSDIGFSHNHLRKICSALLLFPAFIRPPGSGRVPPGLPSSHMTPTSLLTPSPPVSVSALPPDPVQRAGQPPLGYKPCLCGHPG